MRESQMKKIPITIVLGDKEKENDTVNYRLYGSNEEHEMPLSEFIEMVKDKIIKKVR